jgi:adenine-specific DNA methylase
MTRIGGCNPGTTDEALRKALLVFIGNFANWDLTANRTYVEVGRALVNAAYDEGTPLVVDPFAGGGSIPLEALRLGCDAFASDLNPVACLILKEMLEDIPRYGSQLAEEFRRVGMAIKAETEMELGELYPEDPDGATPVAYLWARTVRCEAPKCGAEIPLLRNRWLLKTRKPKRALQLTVDERSKEIVIEVFEPKNDSDVKPGTIRRSRARCLQCGSPLGQDRIQAQLKDQSGGGDVYLDGHGRRLGGATLIAVVIKHRGTRDYRAPTSRDYEAVASAARRLDELRRNAASSRISPIPEEPLTRVPVTFGVINVWVYGVRSWGDLFSVRQKLVLATLASKVRDLPRSSLLEEAVANLVGLAVSRFTDDYSNMMRWMDRGTPAATFARPALPMVWDYCEIAPFDDASWSLSGSFDWVGKAVDALQIRSAGQVERANAQADPLPDEAAAVVFTDPPYYDNIPYSYLSDYFFVWLRRSLVTNQLFTGTDTLTDKREEIVAYVGPDGDAGNARRRFEEALGKAFLESRRVLAPDGIGSVVFAHQTTEGWEALLAALAGSGWVTTASWPIATERKGRPRAHESAALATSVHLICRPRAHDAPVGDWADVLRELPNRVGAWMERLQGEGVRGADLVFACIGPALEIFSQYTKVETAEGREVRLPEYLEKVWEVVGRSALGQVLGTAEARAQNGAAGAVEEDARLTALFLWTLQSTEGEPELSTDGDDEEEPAEEEEDDEGSSRRKAKGYTLVFDVVRRFAQPLGIELPEWEGRIIETKKGMVRLLPITERAKQLFGADGAQAVAARLEREAAIGGNPLQGVLFPETDMAPRIRGSGRGRGRHVSGAVADEDLRVERDATTLDRVHAAMLLQAGGRTNALRALLRAEQERGPDFLRLANALSALYPKGSEEKRLLDAMLLAAPK